MAGPSPRLVGLLALLGLLPVGYYLVATGRTVVAFSLVCVLVIAASVYLVFGPAEESAVGH